MATEPGARVRGTVRSLVPGRKERLQKVCGTQSERTISHCEHLAGASSQPKCSLDGPLPNFSQERAPTIFSYSGAQEKLKS